MRRRHLGTGLALTAAALVSLLGAAPAGAQFDFLDKWGSSGSLDGQFAFPVGIGTDPAGNVYVADAQVNDRAQKFTSSGGFLDKWGSNGSVEGQFEEPHGVDTDAAGNVYVADSIGNRVQAFDSSGLFLRTWGWDVQIGGGHVCTSNCTAGSPGTNNGQFNRVRGIATDATGNVYTSETNNARVQKFSPTGSFLNKWGSNGTGEGKFDSPFGLDVDTAGNVYVADTDNDRIQKFDSSGGFLRMWGWGVDDGSSAPQTCTSDCEAGIPGAGDGQLDNPQDVAVDGAGDVYVADTDNHRIQKFTSSGSFLSKFGSSGSGDGQFGGPVALATDCRDNVYIADTGNDRIQKLGDPAAGDPPCPSPSPSPDPPGSDPAPTLDASAKGKQKAKKLKIEATCDVDCTLELVSGKAKLPTSGAKKSAAYAKSKSFKLQPKSVGLQAGVTETIRVKFKQNRKSVKKIVKLLKSDKKAKKKAKVIAKLVASNAAGTSPTSKVKFKLKR